MDRRTEFLNLGLSRPGLGLSCVSMAQLCLSLCDPMDCNPPGSSAYSVWRACTSVPCLPSCLYSWWGTFKSSRHVFLNQSQGSAHLSPQLPPHLWAAHQENIQFLSLSNLRTNFPQPHFEALVDFSRILYFHLPPLERSNFRGINKELNWTPTPSVHGPETPDDSVLYLSPWFVQALLARPRVLNYKSLIFSLGEETSSFRNMGEL